MSLESLVQALNGTSALYAQNVAPYVDPAVAWTRSTVGTAVHAALAAVGLSDAQVVIGALALVGAVCVSMLLLPWLLSWLRYYPQDLKARYGRGRVNVWAIVTGGSSGIGRSIARALAQQGIHVVIAAVPDALLEKTAAEIRKAFPEVQVRAVGVDLGAADPETYMVPIRAATADIPIVLAYLNAGYMVTGFFADTPLERWMKNYACNLTSPIVLAHYFVNRMKAAGDAGAIYFTSSPANLIPSPFSCMYGATKSALTHFATSLACEVVEAGIDVSVIHPSPVATNFYTGAHALPTLQMFKSTATGPDGIADLVLRSTGRSVIVDQGYYPILFRSLLKLMDLTFLVELMPFIAPYQSDYLALKAASSAPRAPAPAASAPPASEPKTAPEPAARPVARKRRASEARS